jgi:hypothetical protein
MRWTPAKTSLVNLFGTLMFTGFALVQYNDPDPFVWILAYGFVAILCLMASLRVRVLGPALAGAVIYALMGMRQMPAEIPAQWLSGTMAGQPLAVEEVRESLGLFIAAAWCVQLASVSYMRVRASRALATRLSAQAAARPVPLRSAR